MTTTSESNEFVDPETGECVSPEDTDALIDAWERIHEREKVLFNMKARLALVLSEKALQEATTKTVRVRGQYRIIKIERPDECWDQSKLKEAYHAYPQFRDEFLRISQIQVKKRELKKATVTAGPPEFETFMAMVMSAQRPATGLPRITIET